MGTVSSIYNFQEYSEDKKNYDNSEKISELRRRSEISYQNNTWIPVAQYEPRINSYYNLAINLDSITSYCNDYSYGLMHGLNEQISYELNEVDKLIEIGNSDTPDNITYNINNSSIASTIISYGFSYSVNYLDWQLL